MTERELNNWKVYMHWIPANKTKYNYRKYYIGITNREKAEDRWGKNGEGYSRQYFYNAIQKYGWDNFHHKVLYTKLTHDEACKIERELIKKYESTLGHKGYNATEGGECVGKRINRAVYCIEKNMAFKNSNIASHFTKELEATIYNKCKRYSEYKFDIKKGNHWCFLEDMWYALNRNNIGSRNTKNSKPIVSLDKNIIYPSSNYVKRELNISLHCRSVLNKDKYLWYINRNKNVSNKFMFLDEYLELFNYV